VNSATISILQEDSYIFLGLLIDNKFCSHRDRRGGGVPLLHETRSGLFSAVVNLRRKTAVQNLVWMPKDTAVVAGLWINSRTAMKFLASKMCFAPEDGRSIVLCNSGKHT
jgi:hypothetical protein